MVVEDAHDSVNDVEEEDVSDELLVEGCECMESGHLDSADNTDDTDAADDSAEIADWFTDVVCVRLIDRRRLGTRSVFGMR